MRRPIGERGLAGGAGLLASAGVSFTRVLLARTAIAPRFYARPGDRVKRRWVLGVSGSRTASRRRSALKVPATSAVVHRRDEQTSPRRAPRPVGRSLTSAPRRGPRRAPT